MVEIYSESSLELLVKYYSWLWNLARTQIKTHKGDEKWPLFVNKQLFVVCINISIAFSVLNILTVLTTKLSVMSL